MRAWLFMKGLVFQPNRKIRIPGGLAQLGERLHGMQEVSGSIPLFSTKKALYFVGSTVLFFFIPAKRSGGAPLAMQAGQ